MDNKETIKKETNWEKDVALEAWKHHASIGGADKDRMIQIASLLLGFSAAIVGFIFKETVKSDKIVEPVAAIFLSIIGIVIACVSAYITLLYGGYANWNWGKADQIAKECGWDGLDMMKDPPFRIPERRFLCAWALRQAEPKRPDENLAPVFIWFFRLSFVSLIVHLSILVLSMLSLSCKLG